MSRLSQRKYWFISIIIAGFILALSNFVSIKLDRRSIYTAKLPQTMKVARFNAGDEKELYKNVKLVDEKLPKLGDDDVLVQVVSTTFSQKDFNTYKNLQKLGKKSFVPGTDFSGRVVGLGKNVRQFEIGDKVFGMVDTSKQDGACAQYISVPQNNLNNIPYSLTYKQAAAIPTPGLLNWFAYHNIQKHGVKNAKILVDDAISENGIMLTALLVRNGYEVIGMDEDFVIGWLANFGVKDAIGYKKYEEKAKELENKFDVVINMYGGIPAQKLIKNVKEGGTFIGFEDEGANRDGIKKFIINYDKIESKIILKMARLVHLGKLPIKIENEYSLSQVRDAYIRAQKGNINGRIIVNIGK